MTGHPFITQRVWEVHKSDRELEVLLALFQRQRGACDEVWFATDYGFPPLSVHQAAAEKMTAAAERVRALGSRCRCKDVLVFVTMACESPRDAERAAGSQR